MIFMAASTSLALRSFIFASAISRTCATVTVATVSRPVVSAPRGRLRLPTGFRLGGLLQVIRRRRRLDFHREGLVLIVGDDGRARAALFHILGLGVERLAELHDVDAALTQMPGRPAGSGWPDRPGPGASSFQRVSWPYGLSFISTPSGRAHRVLRCCGPAGHARAPHLPHRRGSLSERRRPLHVRSVSRPACIRVRPASPGRRSTPSPSGAGCRHPLPRPCRRNPRTDRH